MKKSFAILSAVAVMTVSLVTPAYARGFNSQRATNMNYTTTVNSYPTIDVEGLVSSRKTYLDSLVSQGLMTQEAASVYLSNYRNMLEFRAANGGYGYGGGLCGGGGYGGGFGGGCAGGIGGYGNYNRGY